MNFNFELKIDLEEFKKNFIIFRYLFFSGELHNNVIMTLYN